MNSIKIINHVYIWIYYDLICVGKYSIINLPSKWSTSCWITLASNPVAFKVYDLLSISVYSTSILIGLVTGTLRSLIDRQPSLYTSVSSENQVILGFIKYSGFDDFPRSSPKISSTTIALNETFT